LFPSDGLIWFGPAAYENNPSIKCGRAPSVSRARLDADCGSEPFNYGARPKILSALWALIREWIKAGKPEAQNIHPSFFAWSRLIGGILESTGFTSQAQCPFWIRRAIAIKSTWKSSLM
jgi:hypothetical protein